MNNSFSVKKYCKEDFSIWNQFVKDSKNGTFLFHRNFMEYHQDRFQDFSLLIYQNETIKAILPANRINNIVHSHQGLSYGGLLIKDTITIAQYVEIIQLILEFLTSEGIQEFYVKEIPNIYHKTISEELGLLSHLLQGEIYRTDTYFVIDNTIGYHPNRNRKRAIKIANDLSIDVKITNDFDIFWDEILTKNLQERFGVNPVHTKEEIKLLAQNFPEYIKFYGAYKNDQLKAGAVIFIKDNVTHFQYSSGTEDRTESGALDILFDTIIKDYPLAKYISFGSSSEQNGKKLNKGLAYWKESFGAQCHIQRFYKFDTSKHLLLQSFLQD